MSPIAYSTVLAIGFAFTFIYFFFLVIRSFNNRRIANNRFNLMQSQLSMSGTAGVRSVMKSEKDAIETQLLRFGDRVVRDKYRDRLSDLSNQVGGASETVFIKLIKRKVYFAIIGLLISFLLVSQGRWYLVIPTLFFTFFAYFVPNLLNFFRRIFTGRYGKKLGDMATFSGSRWKNPEDLIRAKILSSLFAFLAVYLYSLFTSGSLTRISYLLIGIFIGFFVPDVILYNNGAKRREKFAETLPDSIDLLSMCVNAGLAFPAALAKVSEIQKGPVPEEFMRVRTEVQLGKERNEALQEMAARIRLDALNDFVNAVAQVDRFGIPISAALQQQSLELRAERKARGREKAQKVPIKILGPVMLCFLPCVLLIVLGPAIIGIIGIF